MNHRSKFWQGRGRGVKEDPWERRHAPLDPLLSGTTLSVADGVAPSAGMPAVVQPETISFHTIYTITTDRATISFDNTGVFNPDVSIFAELYVVIGGTGIFEGATGFMMDMGRGTTGFRTTDVLTQAFARIEAAVYAQVAYNP